MWRPPGRRGRPADQLSGQKQPKNKDDVELTTLIPAFILSELRAAFIIGFVIFHSVPC